MGNTLLTLLNPSTTAAYTAAGYWGDETIYRLTARQVRTVPGAFAVRDRRRRLTYAALVEAADRLAAGLAGHGIRPGQLFAWCLPSRLETAFPLLAFPRTGFGFFPSVHLPHTAG